MYSFHLFLIFSASTRSLLFLSFIVPICGWNIPLISSTRRSLFFLFLLFPSSFMHGSLKKSFLSFHAVLWNSAFSWIYLSLSPLLFASLPSLAIYKASSDNHFAFLLFSFFEMVLFTASCTILRPSNHSSSGNCLLYLIPWNYLLPPLHIHRDLI